MLAIPFEAVLLGNGGTLLRPGSYSTVCVKWLALLGVLCSTSVAKWENELGNLIADWAQEPKPKWSGTGEMGVAVWRGNQVRYRSRGKTANPRPVSAWE